MVWLLMMFVLGDLEPVGTFETKTECVEAGKASEGWFQLSNADWSQNFKQGFVCVPAPPS